MQHLIYKGVQRLTAEKPALTSVTLDVDGELTDLGFVLRSKGDAAYTATLISGAMYSTGHKTKKQAGGALKKLHDGAPQNSGKLVETNAPTVDSEQAKKDKRNARRRELRRLAKAA